MLRTFGGELTSLLNSDPAWKVSKGSRSASRRARKPLCQNLNNSAGLVCRNSEVFNMPVSESEKRGVSVLGYRFSENAEHVPIKKRRFLYRAPSPTPPPPSPPHIISPASAGGIAGITKNQEASSTHAAVEVAPSDVSVSQVTDNSTGIPAVKTENAHETPRGDEDFSGISILAAAACSSSLGRDCSYADDGSGVEASSAQGISRDALFSTEPASSSGGVLKDDLVISSEMSTGATSSCVSTEPVGVLASASTTVNSSQNAAIYVQKDVDCASVGADSLTVPGDNSCSKKEETVRMQKTSPKDDRLHWDLNVVMDAWEHPLDSPHELPHDTLYDAREIKHDDDKKNFDGYGSQDNLAFTYAEQSSPLPGEPKNLTHQTLSENKLNCDEGSCQSVALPFRLDVKSQLSNCSETLDAIKRVAEDTKYMGHSDAVNPTGGFVDSVLPTTQISAPEAIREDADGSLKVLKLNGEEHLMQRQNVSSSVCAADMTFQMSLVDLTETSLCVSSNPDDLRLVVPNVAVAENLEKSRELHCDDNALLKFADCKTNEPPERARFAALDRKNIPDLSAHAEAPGSVLINTKEQDMSSICGGNAVCSKDIKMNLSEKSPAMCKETRASMCNDACKANLDNLDKSLNSYGKYDPAEHSNHNNDAVVRCHPRSRVRLEITSDLPDDYDSQYEDGELREPNELAWEGYEVVDGEAEHLDYGSDDQETCATNPSDYNVSELGKDELKSGGVGVVAVVSSNVGQVDDPACGKAAKLIGDDITHDGDFKGKSWLPSEEKSRAPKSKVLLESKKSSSDMEAGVRDDIGRKGKMSGHVDMDSKGTEARIGSKTFKRGLQSRVEGPIAHDSPSQEERPNRVGNRYEESTSMRSFERGRYPFHNHAKGKQGDSWDGSANAPRGFRRHYSPIVHRHSKADDDGTMERNETGYIGAQDNVSYSHRLLPRGRSGTDEETCPVLHSCYRHDRKFSPDRPMTFGRGRSFRHGPFVDGRGGRGRYTGCSPDESFQSSLKFRRPLSRRERSFSPFGGSGHSNVNYSRGKCQSRSRSRSPIMWNTSRGRPVSGTGGNTFIRHRSRSPNFRSDVRVQRLRSPHHQAGFGADHGVGFRAIPRSQDSPPRGRWISARKNDPGQFREFGYKQRAIGMERSPGRIRPRGDRDNVADSPRNSRNDGFFRLSDRMSEDGADRGLRYEDNYEDRRKHYGPLRPARRSYEDGMANRLHQDIDDGFSVGNGMRDRNASNFQVRGLRGIDSRIGDYPRRFRGEQHSFVCDRDGKFNASSKIDTMDSSSNLKSEQPYRTTHAGRFIDIDGAD